MMYRVGFSKKYLRLMGLLMLLALIFSASTVQHVLSQSSPDLMQIESDDLRVGQHGAWTTQATPNASGASYLYSSGSPDDILTINFYGSSIEIIYVGHPSFGSFAIDIDNDIRRTVVSTSAETTFNNRALVDYLEDDFHTLQIYAVDGVIGIDAFITRLAPPDEFRDKRIEATCDLNDILQIASKSSDGTLGNGDSFNVELSADGRYVSFDSDATNLVANDTNNATDIFVYDRLTCETVRVSISSLGEEGNNWSRRPDISDDGRYVVFESNATNLIANDTNYWTDIYLHDRQSGQTSRVSVSTSGAQGRGYSLYPAISGDGSTIVYQSEASELVATDTNWMTDIFLYNRTTQETTLITQSPSADPSNSSSGHVDISADGQVVVFYSYASNLVAADTGHFPDIFVYDRSTDQISRVNESTGGAEANDWSLHPAISADGNVVTFMSRATNLVADDTNASEDIFVHNRTTGDTVRVSLASDGGQSNGHGDYPDISSNGRYIVYYSEASNHVGDDSNDTFDVFWHDSQTGETTLLSASVTVVQGNNPSRYPVISDNGVYAAFESDASNLVTGDGNAVRDIFVRQLINIEPPQSLTATSISRTQINLTWSDLSGDSPTFHVERSPSGVDNWGEIGTTTATSFSNFNLTCGTAYYYRVYAMVGAVQSVPSNIAIATTNACLSNKPVLIAPLGGIVNLLPTFQWTEAGNATWYRLYISRGSTLILDKWYEIGSSILTCDGSICAVTPLLSLTNGNYSWWVNGWGPSNGYTEWSDAGAFNINILAPGTVNKTAPSNESTLTNGNVTFTWDHDPNTTWYHFWLGSSTWYKASDICVAGTCSTQRSLNNATYSWYVQGYGPGGFGSWGTGFTFTISVPTPAIVNKTAPANGATLTLRETTFTWDHDPNTTWYHFWLGSSTWYKASDICVAGTCSTQRSLTNDAYIWYVQGYGPGGYGDWGSGFTFTVVVPKPAIITKTSPIGAIAISTPDFVWQHDPNTTWYQVWIGSIDSTIDVQWYQASTICSDGTCTIPPPRTYIGEFRWYVRGWGTGGYGEWGTETLFSYTISLNAPIATVNGINITYEWNNVGPTTTWYQLWVGTIGNVNVVHQWINAATFCNTTTCSFTKAITLPAGNYNWYIQPYGSYGYGPWSTAQAFTVSP